MTVPFQMARNIAQGAGSTFFTKPWHRLKVRSAQATLSNRASAGMKLQPGGPVARVKDIVREKHALSPEMTGSLGATAFPVGWIAEATPKPSGQRANLG